MKLILFLLVILNLNTVLIAKDTGVALHPTPKKPIFLTEDWYTTLKQNVSPPPAAGSEQQKKDEEELFRFQKNRTSADCQRAQSEVAVNLNHFFGSPNGPLGQNEITLLSPFFEQVRNDADYFVQKLKVDFPRRRPFLYLKNLNPCVPKEVTGAYPSGHAVLSKLFAVILSDFYPQHGQALESRAKQIADNRILGGMHHRSDIEVGRSLASLVYEELKKSEKYKAEFNKLRTLVQ